MIECDKNYRIHISSVKLFVHYLITVNVYAYFIPDVIYYFILAFKIHSKKQKMALDERKNIDRTENGEN